MFVSESRALELGKSRRKPVRITKLVMVGLALTLFTGLGGSSVRAVTSSIIDVVPATGKIEGSGATFPLNQYRDWFSAFTDEYRDIKCESATDADADGELADCTDSTNNIRQFDPGNAGATGGLVLGYTGVGSGSGKTNFYGADCRKSTQMFSGTDSLLSSTNYTAMTTASGACKDAATSTPIGASGYIMVPATAGAISMVYNLPGLLQYTSTAKTRTTSASLNLDAAAICDIYTGKIKKWNDAAIKALNPLVKTSGTGSLPNQNIITVARAESSGTTFIFSTYLAKANDNATMRQCGFNTAFGKATTVSPDNSARTLTTSDGTTAVAHVAGDLIPQEESLGTKFNALRRINNAGTANPITGKAANGGIATYVKATPYSFGYVELSFQLKYSLKAAKIRTATNLPGNKANYIAPSVAGTTAALTQAYGTAARVTASKVMNPPTTGIAGGGFMHAVQRGGVASYPIVGVTWILVYTQWGTAATTPAADAASKGQVQGLVAFLEWALSDGQASYNLYQGYAPLPAALRTAALAELDKIQYNGVDVRP
jgi:ABC-type phosphate transport system substrate-binding protein